MKINIACDRMHLLLHSNALELSAEAAIHARQYKDAEKFLDDADAALTASETLLLSNGTWQAVNNPPSWKCTQVFFTRKARRARQDLSNPISCHIGAGAGTRYGWLPRLR